MKVQTGAFKKSILIVAHPDDEALWFSSILNKVDKLIICFLKYESKPDLTAGRQRSLSEYPLNNMSCLGLEESEAFSANWENPEPTRYGIRMTQKSHFLKRRFNKKYIDNYYKLKEALEHKLKGYHSVFTHNPWGEYGNAEHIQIYMVIKQLQEGLSFNLWYPNYCSNKSYNLMLYYASNFATNYLTMAVNKTLANELEILYRKYGCWTWYDGWTWFNEESFMRDVIYEGQRSSSVYAFPLNMIKLRIANKSNIFKKVITEITNMPIANRYRF